jgi:hypothetical protein
VRLRLRNILGRAEDALFQRSIYGYPQDWYWLFIKTC